MEPVLITALGGLATTITSALLTHYLGKSKQKAAEHQERHEAISLSCKTSTGVSEPPSVTQPSMSMIHSPSQSFEGPCILSRSIVRDGAKSNVRDPDAQVATDFANSVNGKVSFDQSISSHFPECNLFAIGSTRYNPHSTWIQKTFELPFQYVVARQDEKPEHWLIRIVTAYGEELMSSRDRRTSLGVEGIDYGIIFAGKAPNGKHLLWVSGIHGAGTLGAYEYYKRNRTDIHEAYKGPDSRGTAWLVRVLFKRNSLYEDDQILEVECLGKRSCGTRPTAVPRMAVITDLGNVLMYFDRTRTYRGLAHTCGLSYDHVKAAIEKSDIRERYELGQLEDSQFVKELIEIIGGPRKCYDEELVSEMWGDIFWLNREMVHALKSLKASGVPIVLLSNTNSIHYKHIEKYYPDVCKLFDDTILSYVNKHAKPDDAIFSEAIFRTMTVGNISSVHNIIYIDDTEEYVQAANSLGLQGFSYRSYTQFAYWIREHGLYID